VDAPNLVGLSLRQARVRAARHGCRIELESVQPPRGRPGQRVVEQSTPPGKPSSYPAIKPGSDPIKVWLAPHCPKADNPGPTAPPAIEPALTAGPTELIGGARVIQRDQL
jgi:hypothetical protein